VGQEFLSLALHLFQPGTLSCAILN
jgi:hypothetical protein